MRGGCVGLCAWLARWLMALRAREGGEGVEETVDWIELVGEQERR